MSCQTLSDLVYTSLFELNFGDKLKLQILNFFEIVDILQLRNLLLD